MGYNMAEAIPKETSKLRLCYKEQKGASYTKF